MVGSERALSEVDGLGEGREAPPTARDTVKHCDAQDSESKGIHA